MNSSKTIFYVHYESGGYVQVYADNEEDAIEEYWQSMESIFGHIEESCDCFKNPKRFPREKYKQPIKVTSYN